MKGGNSVLDIISLNCFLYRWRETLSREFYTGDCSLGESLVQDIKIWKLPIMDGIQKHPGSPRQMGIYKEEKNLKTKPNLSTECLACLDL